MTNWRLILSQNNTPHANMATDEAILKAYAAGKAPPTLRIYSWKPESISLGYFQKAKEVLNTKRCLDQSVLFVRRITGGEAIFHGDDLTYSIICSKDDLVLPESVKESFKTISSFLINAYKAMGLEAAFSCENQDVVAPIMFESRKRSDFCFAANQDFDITIKGKKIGGNAQKRRRNMIFQHGSIPLSLDINRISLFLRENLKDVKDRVISLSDAAGRKISFDDFSEIIIKSFQKTFGLELNIDKLTDEELQVANTLSREKYENKEWNYSADYD
ncbi:MAG: lipoate--protein ligase family protein [PVC group bacterium]|nr:lipoate--protein ligase family protein [PVC group bacterium]